MIIRKVQDWTAYSHFLCQYSLDGMHCESVPWSAQENQKIGTSCMMSDFKAKMHQIQFPLVLRPQTPLRELTALPRPLELHL